ncbi:MULTISPECIES: hypothetical protein [unclassified Methylobacterium]|uniref:hypothetical protein n=1 Tax=unclassified Methylobacterium TaxID=2615210 RepID=UPI00226AC853|nr:MULTISPECIES: hypothetical protein [unclassified Methylobacterium]
MSSPAQAAYFRHSRAAHFRVDAAGALKQEADMKKPAGAGAHGLFNGVVFAADANGYASAAHALQVRHLAARSGLSRAVAALKAEHCHGVPESWRTAR